MSAREVTIMTRTNRDNAEGRIYNAFLDRCAQNPEAMAVVDEHGSVTYGQLASMAERIAEQLPKNARFVGIIMDHGAEMIAAMLAALKNGAAYVPAEPDFPPDRIGFMLDECQAEAVITQKGYEHLARGGAQIILVEPGTLSEQARQHHDTGFAPEPSQAQPQDLAYVLYTSGTTGTPKGVAVENHNVCSYIQAFQHEFHLTPADRMLQHSVCSFDIFVEEVFSTLLAGAALIIAPQAVKEDTESLVTFINANAVSVVDGFPYLMDDLNAASPRPATVRLYISGGDVLHASQVSNLVTEAKVYNTYGPSETTCCVSYFRCDHGEPEPDGTYAVGRPILGTRIDVVDESLQPVAAGEVGEFLITGGGVSRGYLGHHPEQANFIVDADGSRQYRSGDVGYAKADGNLVFLHRKDDQVMIQGKRVEAKEVENVLMQDPAIHQAVVVPGRDDGGFSFLVAYIVPAEDQCSLTDLKKRMARHLTPFMIPEFFIKMNSIPLNTHGKPAVEKLPVVLKAVT